MSVRKTETTAAQPTPVASPSPKKRGRPPKAQAEAAAPKTAKDVASAAIPDTAQKKRGRPKKSEAEVTVSQKSKPSETKDNGMKTEASDTSSKKRGRPKKAPEDAAQNPVYPNITGKSKSLSQKAKTAEDKPSEISSKTPQVMRLVEQRNDMINPTIMAGKSSIPRKLRGLEPLSKIMKREAEEIFGTNEDAETFNVTALVIEENASEILRRFNACDCEICVEQLCALTAEKLPARFAKLKKRAVERNAPEVEELKAPLRRSVTSQMIRLVITNKKRSFHD